MMLLLALTSSSVAFAESKLAVDMNFTKVSYEKPAQGVGKAGTMVFKTASLVNNGIVFNINNINNLFDSQLFVRPTFLGFTTQFGNFGVTIEETSILNTVKKTEIENAKFILDDNQLNFAGKMFTFVDQESSAKLLNFRLYCQKALKLEETQPAATPDIVKSCLNFMTLNASVEDNKGVVDLEYETVNKANPKAVTKFAAKVKTLDVRPSSLAGSLPAFKSVSTEDGNTYSINASNLAFSCAKDPELEKIDSDKMIKTCLNRVQTQPFTAVLEDSKEKTAFDLNFSHIAVAEKVLTTKINSVSLKDLVTGSTTNVSDVNLKCRKEKESDLLVVTDILRDCVSSGQVSIGKVYSVTAGKAADPTNNISMSVQGGAIVIQADVKVLGITGRVTINGKASIDEKNKIIYLTVISTKLPFIGISWNKLVMNQLKKDLVSKDISISENTITIKL